MLAAITDRAGDEQTVREWEFAARSVIGLRRPAGAHWSVFAP